MALDLTVLLPIDFLELAADRIEGIPDDRLQVVMDVAFRGFTLGHQHMSRRNAHFDAHPIGLAASLKFVGFFNSHAAAGDMIAYLVHLSGFFTNQTVNAVAFSDIAVGYFNRNFHIGSFIWGSRL